MLLLKLNKHIVNDIIKDDPVRPHIEGEWRTDHGREVYGLYEDESYEKLLAVICVAYTANVPKTEKGMNYIGKNVAVFYTVWSYERGAGRSIVNAVSEHIKKNYKKVQRQVTLSPLTDMAERFHTRNGAELIGRYNDCQNFEYKS